MAKSKYLDKKTVLELANECEQILSLRNTVYKKFGIDPLDTDALSSLAIYQIVNQYDPDYNPNFARNGEDAKSNNTLIECKATTVKGNLTPTGKDRTGAGTDAGFTFHAMGDLEYPRYILAVRFKDNLKLDRIYDIGESENTGMVVSHLMAERKAWLERGRLDEKKMKRDAIVISEKVLLKELKITEKLTINGCRVFRA